MRIRFRLIMAEAFHNNAITLGMILGILAICFMIVAGL